MAHIGFEDKSLPKEVDFCNMSHVCHRFAQPEAARVRRASRPLQPETTGPGLEARELRSVKAYSFYAGSVRDLQNRGCSA